MSALDELVRDIRVSRNTYIIRRPIVPRTLQNAVWEDVGELIQTLGFPIQAKDGLLESPAAAGECDRGRSAEIHDVSSDWSEYFVDLEDLVRHLWGW